jgi:hypothetical protein
MRQRGRAGACRRKAALRDAGDREEAECLEQVAANAQAGPRVGDGAGPATGGRERPGRTACRRWCGSCAAQAAALLPLAGRLTIFNCRGFVAPVLTRLEGSAAGGCAGRGPGPPGALAGERAPRTAVITKTFFVTKDPCLLPASNLRDHANCQWAIVRRHAGGPPVSATVEIRPTLTPPGPVQAKGRANRAGREPAQARAVPAQPIMLIAHTQYQPGLVEGFLAGTGLDLTPLCKPRN